MDDQQSNFKVVDRRPFNPDGTPRELSPEEKQEAERVAESLKIPATETPQRPTTTASQSREQSAAREQSQAIPPKAAPREEQQPRAGRDPLDDPASFLSLIMSLASNAAAS